MLDHTLYQTVFASGSRGGLSGVEKRTAAAEDGDRFTATATLSSSGRNSRCIKLRVGETLPGAHPRRCQTGGGKKTEEEEGAKRERQKNQFSVIVTDESLLKPEDDVTLWCEFPK